VVGFFANLYMIPTVLVAKSKKQNVAAAIPPESTRKKRRVTAWTLAAVAVLPLVIWARFQVVKHRNSAPTAKIRPANGSAHTNPSVALSPSLGEKDGARGRDAVTTVSKQSTNPPAASALASTLEVAQAVMVTVELDFGGMVPSVAAALEEIERRYEPDDGRGRTFAILDGYGEGTPDEKLHLSMHVSTEKPGGGSLIFKRTGATLWSGRIIPSKDPSKQHVTGKNLSIYLDDGTGKLLTVDGSNNPAWIMDALVRERGVPLDTVWPTGVEHEITFMYSACGCPVKVMARREGDRVVRTKELPVIFPDDPAAREIIARLMRW